MYLSLHKFGEYIETVRMDRTNMEDVPKSEGETTTHISDPIMVSEAREILGVSPTKMSQLLRGKLPWVRSDLDERIKYVSRQAVENLKKVQPTGNRKGQRKESAKEPAQATKSKATLYLAEWMSVLGITAQELARRSKERAGQHTGSFSQLALREDVLRAKGVSLPTIRRIARKQQHPYPVTIERLAAALGITADELMQQPPQG